MFVQVTPGGRLMEVDPRGGAADRIPQTPGGIGPPHQAPLTPGGLGPGQAPPTPPGGLGPPPAPFTPAGIAELMARVPQTPRGLDYLPRDPDCQCILCRPDLYDAKAAARIPPQAPRRRRRHAKKMASQHAWKAKRRDARQVKAANGQRSTSGVKRVMRTISKS